MTGSTVTGPRNKVIRNMYGSTYIYENNQNTTTMIIGNRTVNAPADIIITDKWYTNGSNACTSLKETINETHEYLASFKTILLSGTAVTLQGGKSTEQTINYSTLNIASILSMCPQVNDNPGWIQINVKSVSYTSMVLGIHNSYTNNLTITPMMRLYYRENT